MNFFYLWLHETVLGTVPYKYLSFLPILEENEHVLLILNKFLVNSSNYQAFSLYYIRIKKLKVFPDICSCVIGTTD